MNLIENFRRTDIQIESIGKIGNNLFKLKPFPIKRALENLINNADRYGEKILIEKKIENNFLIFPYMMTVLELMKHITMKCCNHLLD